MSIRSFSQLLAASRVAPWAPALGALSALAMCTGSARGRPQTYQEYSPASTPTGALGTYPADSATSHNNNRAAVRYSNPASNAVVLTIWDLNATGTPTAAFATFGGGTLKSGEQTNLTQMIYGYWPSDRIELTNSRGVSIGSGFSSVAGARQDETYIELFSVNATPTFINQWVISPSSAGNVDGAGYANDVEITRDGVWAIINSDNWIHALDITAVPTPVLHGLHIGDIDYRTNPPTTGWGMPCSPNQAVDSVALINDVAVVTTARTDPAVFGGRPTTWVYLIDLASTPPKVRLQDHFAPPAGWNPTAGDDQDPPHDVEIVAIADIERYGVVTTRHGVALYDLVNFVRIGTHFAANEQRLYQWQVDSVEAENNRRAVVISDDISTGVPLWTVRVFKLALGSFAIENTYRAPVTAIADRAHDLAFDNAANKAIVRTSFKNVILTSVAPSPALPVVLTSPNASNAHEYRNFRNQTNFSVFSSDSVAICPDVNGVVMAATIGAYVDIFGKRTGGVDLIDLAAATLSVSQTNIGYDSLSTYGCVPVDLAISANYSEVVVRSIDTYFSSISALDSDVVRVSLTSPFLINMRYAGHGTCNGVDSLSAPLRGFVNFPTNKRTLTISEDPFPNGNDYAHISN